MSPPYDGLCDKQQFAGVLTNNDNPEALFVKRSIHT